MGLLRKYLKDNHTIHYISKEFQTGNKSPTQGRKAIDAIAGLQDSLGRKLHPLIIGGAQFVEYVAARFETFTLVDSEPFVKTNRRRRFDLTAGKRPWRETWTLIDQGLDHILGANVAEYAAWIGQRSSFGRSRTNITEQGDRSQPSTPTEPALAHAV